MESRLNKLATALMRAVLASAVAGCSGVDEPYDAAEPTVFPLIVPAEDLDLGTVWAPTRSSLKLHIRNTSSEEIQLSELKTSCACCLVDFSPLTIRPTEQRIVTLALDVSSRLSVGESNGEPNFHAQLIPIVKGYTGPPASWPITGTVRTLLRVSASFVEFETWTVGEPVPIKSIDVVSAAPLASLRAETDPLSISCNIVQRSELEYTVQIRPNADLRPGPFRTSVRLVADLATGGKVESLITAMGRTVDEVEALPYSIDWGSVSVGSVCESRVLVRSRVGKPFVIERTSSESGEIVVQREDSQARGDVLLLKQRIVAAGKHQDKVLLQVRNHDGAIVELAIPVSYWGVRRGP